MKRMIEKSKSRLEWRECANILRFREWIRCCVLKRTSPTSASQLYWENSPRICDSRCGTLIYFEKEAPYECVTLGMQSIHHETEYPCWVPCSIWKVRLNQMHPASNKENSTTFWDSLYKSLDISWKAHLIQGCHACTEENSPRNWDSVNNTPCSILKSMLPTSESRLERREFTMKMKFRR